MVSQVTNTVLHNVPVYTKIGKAPLKPGTKIIETLDFSKLKYAGPTENVATKTGVFSKILNGIKGVGSKIIHSKIGKFGLIGAGVAALIGAGVWLYNKLKDSNGDKTNPETPTKPDTPTKPTGPKKPAVPTKPAKPEKPAEPEKPAVPTQHEVVKGDNVWNIAKAHLIAQNPEHKPSNKEILAETKRLMEVNNLHFESDNYHVMIRPGDIIKFE